MQEAAQGYARLARVRRPEKKIDDFLEMLPPIQMLAACHEAQALDQVQEITSELDGRDYLQAPECDGVQHPEALRGHRGVRRGCGEEEQVEMKLKQVTVTGRISRACLQRVQATRRVVLDMVATAELIEKLETPPWRWEAWPTTDTRAVKGKVQDWITKMATIEEIINMWLNVQNMGMYMEAVFSGGDIVKQLPSRLRVQEHR